MKNHFEFIEYNGVSYPEGYCSTIKEIAGHLDKENIETTNNYSLHTEYSYGKRKFDSRLISNFEELKTSHKDGVPQLWKTDKWAKEFSHFIIELTKDKIAPTTIEIHPPFNDYCNIDLFLDRYLIFEKEIHKTYPNTIIVVENRSGSIYRGGKFIVGKAKEIIELCEKIKARNINLGLVLDFPQLLTSERLDTLKFKADKYFSLIDEISKHSDIIKGVHIWGKKKSESGRWVAHAGNLNTYFDNNEEYKKVFIDGIKRICDDNIKRFLVPEVNTGADDLASIMQDIFGV